MRNFAIGGFSRSFLTRRGPAGVLVLIFAMTLATAPALAGESSPLRGRLKGLPLKIAWECYVDGNSEIFVMDADGSNPTNLTKTPDRHEHYPQVSPDGTKICFNVDSGEGRNAVRSLWVMDVNGANRRKIADQAREPFWSPDGKVIGYLPQEYAKFDVIDYYTKGMQYYHLDTGKSEAHPNSEKLRHLYHPRFSPNGKWVVATVHGGMGFSHAILAIEAHGDKIIDLKIPGCRPTVSPDGKHIAWGSGDHQLDTAPIDFDTDHPTVGPWELRIKDEPKKIYHIAWSPDGKFVCFSRGPESEGDLKKAGTFGAACEIIGVYAAGWDLYAVAADGGSREVDLGKAGDHEVVQLTSNGASNKEPCWFTAAPRSASAGKE
jgi:Tol biopolymer transport system component